MIQHDSFPNLEFYIVVFFVCIEIKGGFTKSLGWDFQTVFTGTIPSETILTYLLTTPKSISLCPVVGMITNVHKC